MSGEIVSIADAAFEQHALASILTPDTLLPSQYRDQRSSPILSPEQMLYLAILEDAVECWLRGGAGATNKRVLKLKIQAEQWIWGIGGNVTFVDCCEALGISPVWLRTKLETLRDRRPLTIRGIRHTVCPSSIPVDQ